VHADDVTEHGRISELARDVVAQFEMITGDEIEVFLDRDKLDWGDEWRPKIDESLANIAFFIPVITPRYFKSVECRRELQYFARRASELGVKELVLPLLYQDFPGLHEDEPDEPLVRLTRAFQWEDWTELRFAERASGDYRRAVMKLAQRLVAANAAADAADLLAAAESIAVGDDGEDVDEAGTLDRIAAAEEAMPKWTETIEEIAEAVGPVAEIMQRGTADLQESDRKGKGFAGRLRITRRIAGELDEPSGEMLRLGEKFSSDLHTVDSGMRALIQHADAEVAEDPEAAEAICVFFGQITSAASETGEAFDAVQQLVDVVAPLGKHSRDLRPPVRTLRRGLTMMLEGREVIEGWARLVQASSVQCDEQSD
jgi:hypothetical protein